MNIRAVVNEDLNRLEDKARDKEKMQRLLRSLARNESTTASVRLIKKDIENADERGVDEDTIVDYLEARKKLIILMVMKLPNNGSLSSPLVCLYLKYYRKENQKMMVDLILKLDSKNRYVL